MRNIKKIIPSNPTDHHQPDLFVAAAALRNPSAGAARLIQNATATIRCRRGGAQLDAGNAMRTAIAAVALVVVVDVVVAVEWSCSWCWRSGNCTGGWVIGSTQNGTRLFVVVVWCVVSRSHFIGRSDSVGRIWGIL